MGCTQKTRLVLKILIVDDTPSTLDVLSTELKNIEHSEIRTADNGMAALMEVGNFHPDIILLDIMMPGMDGAEVCKRIKEKETHIKIIAMSGLASNKEPALAAGADIFLEKPFKDIAKTVLALQK